MASPVALELYEIECFYCGAPFWICVPEYRGQRYCPEGDCRKRGYAALTRERGREYQKTNGRENHAARQQALRDKAKHDEQCQASSEAELQPTGSEGTPRSIPEQQNVDPPSRAVDGTAGAGDPGCVLRNPGDVTHGAGSEPSPSPATVPPIERPGPGGEVPHAQPDGSGLDEGGGGAAPTGAGAGEPGLPRCCLCKRAGVVTYRFSREHPEGVRVERPAAT